MQYAPTSGVQDATSTVPVKTVRPSVTQPRDVVLVRMASQEETVARIRTNVIQAPTSVETMPPALILSVLLSVLAMMAMNALMARV